MSDTYGMTVYVLVGTCITIAIPIDCVNQYCRCILARKFIHILPAEYMAVT